MQPYFLPYIGYWQLINTVDTFVIYDDVNFIKKGYVNRNSILNAGHRQRIILELIGASQNILIKEIEVGRNRGKILKSIDHAYKKAPEFEKVFPLIQIILDNPEKNLAKFLGNSIKMIVEYLGIDTKIIYSSDIEKDNNLKAQAKILDICQRLGASQYINAIGGKELYIQEAFKNKGIELNFLQAELLEYKQFNNKFIPHLSIIDVMMFNSKETIPNMMKSYKLL